MPEFYSEKITNSADNIMLGRVRLYVAGVLLPVISITVSSAVGSAPTASFTTVTDPKLFDMGRMDRVPVQIFVKETMAGKGDYILLFEGFITSRTYINSALQQIMSYEAVAYMDVLSDAKLKFLTSVDDVFMASAAGAPDKQRNISALGNLAYPSCLYRKGLGLNGSTDLIDYPVQFLENIYGFISNSGPSSLPAQQGTSSETAVVPSANHLNNSALAVWHHKWASEIRLMSRYVPLPYFDYIVTERDAVTGKETQVTMSNDPTKASCFPILIGLEKSEALSMLVQGGMSASTEASAMELLTNMADDLEYEYMYLASPAYHNTGNRLTDKMVSSVVKPIFNDTMPPQCNVIFRSQVTRVTSTEVFKGVPTRIQMHDVYSPLAKMCNENNDSSAVKFGLINYYPSSKYIHFDTLNSEPAYFRELSSEMLKSEQHTGPWVHEVNFPKWFGYLNDNYGSNDNAPKEYNMERTLKERFFRRQLLMSKYMDRALQVDMTFNPYVTVGFPGVVFDGENIPFNFAGHVDSVVHTITADGMSTSMQMHFVRSLDEAAVVEIPSPVLEVMAVTHNQPRLSKIYQTILGDGDPSIIGAEFDDVQGAKAVTFNELNQLYTAKSEDGVSPQNNIAKAYQYQRRNIITFDQYCTFHDLFPEYGIGPDGNDTPIGLVSVPVERTWDNLSAFLTVDRHPLGEFSGIANYDMAGLLNAVGSEKATAPGIEPESIALAPIDESLRNTLKEVASREFSRYIYKGSHPADNLS